MLIIAANWKMHKTGAEAADFCRQIRQKEARLQGVEVLICPPFTALPAARTALEGSPIRLGAQNMFWEEKGAFTGEISAPMLLELGVSYVIIGHSERRQIFGETDDLVRHKLEAALRHGLKPILCVGETGEERGRGAVAEVMERQLRAAFEGLSGLDEDLIVAYEPVWAIGTGQAASPGDADEAAGLIREAAARWIGAAAAERLRVQYGGSVNPGNIGDFVSLPSIDGALVGGASLEVDTYVSLIENARAAAEN